MGFTFNNRELVVNVNVDTVNVTEGIESTPPSGMCKVTNVYVDPQTEKFKAKWDDIPEE